MKEESEKHGNIRELDDDELDDDELDDDELDDDELDDDDKLYDDDKLDDDEPEDHKWLTVGNAYVVLDKLRRRHLEKLNTDDYDLNGQSIQVPSALIFEEVLGFVSALMRFQLQAQYRMRSRDEYERVHHFMLKRIKGVFRDIKHHKRLESSIDLKDGEMARLTNDPEPILERLANRLHTEYFCDEDDEYWWERKRPEAYPDSGLKLVRQNIKEPVDKPQRLDILTVVARFEELLREHGCEFPSTRPEAPHAGAPGAEQTATHDKEEKAADDAGV